MTLDIAAGFVELMDVATDRAGLLKVDHLMLSGGLIEVGTTRVVPGWVVAVLLIVDHLSE